MEVVQSDIYTNNYQEYCNNADTYIQEQREKYQNELREEKEKEEGMNQLFLEKNPEFWYAEEINTYIPVNIRTVISLDNCNNIGCHPNEDGSYSISKTQKWSNAKHFTIEEYHNKFCKYDNNRNIWIYKN
jgi:hypothetical protein